MGGRRRVNSVLRETKVQDQGGERKTWRSANPQITKKGKAHGSRTLYRCRWWEQMCHMTQGCRLAVVVKRTVLTHRSIFFLWIFFKWFTSIHVTKISVTEQLSNDPTTYIVEKYLQFSSKTSFIFLHHSCSKAHPTVKQRCCCTCGLQFIPTNSHEVIQNLE